MAVCALLHALPIDLVPLLPPAPVVGSQQVSRDMQAVPAVQAAGPPQEKATKADSVKSGFRFSDVFGPRFPADKLLHTAAFFALVGPVDKQLEKQAEAYWHHSRPPVLSSKVVPIGVVKPDDWNHSSAHATFGYVMAVLLANMLPGGGMHSIGW